MKNLLYLLLTFVILSCGEEDKVEPEGPTNPEPEICETVISYNEMANKISWYGDACFSIVTDDITIFADPYDIQTAMPADLVLISHSHHYRSQFVSNVLTAQTTTISSNDVDIESEGANIKFAPNRSHTYSACCKIETVPAYGDDAHPRSNNWLGFIITLNDVKLYYTGSSMRIPEMANIECDILLVRVLPQHTLDDMPEIAEIAKDVKAKIVIPLHWDISAVQSTPNHDNVVRLAELLDGIAEVKELANSK